jgi:SAM-dependent methyltransferase
MLGVFKFRLSIFISILIRKWFTLRTRLFYRNGTSEYWSSPVSRYSAGGFKSYWESLDAVGRYQQFRMTGDGNKDCIQFTLEYLKKNVGEKDLDGLSIGCSEEAKPEMTFYKTGLFRSFKVMDIAYGLLQRQEAVARAQGINTIKYTQQDLNHVILEKDAYDLIWALGTVHHIEQLEFFFAQVHRALKDNGIFVMREYVGPNYIQFTEDQLKRVNDLLKTLPAKFKRKWNGLPKRSEKRGDLAHMVKTDPSEAVRSSEIIPLLQKELHMVHFAKTGGTLLHPLLNGIAGNFEIVPGSAAILNELIELEKKLVDEGTIPSDYMFCIAKKMS